MYLPVAQMHRWVYMYNTPTCMLILFDTVHFHRVEKAVSSTP